MEFLLGLALGYVIGMFFPIPSLRDKIRELWAKGMQAPDE